LYTSNLNCNTCFLVNESTTEYSTGSGGGYGELTFINPVCQGATKYGFDIARSTDRPIEIINNYVENCYGGMAIGRAIGVHVTGGDLGRMLHASATHDIWIGYDSSGTTANIRMTNVRFANRPHILDRLNADVGNLIGGMSVINPGLMGFFAKLERTNNMPASMPLYVQEAGNPATMTYNRATNENYTMISSSFDATPSLVLAKHTIPITSIARYV
jgi:hypothetical protein